jgi:hypothetical protein
MAEFPRENKYLPDIKFKFTVRCHRNLRAWGLQIMCVTMNVVDGVSAVGAWPSAINAFSLMGLSTCSRSRSGQFTGPQAATWLGVNNSRGARARSCRRRRFPAAGFVARKQKGRCAKLRRSWNINQALCGAIICAALTDRRRRLPQTRELLIRPALT